MAIKRALPAKRVLEAVDFESVERSDGTESQSEPSTCVGDVGKESRGRRRARVLGAVAAAAAEEEARRGGAAERFFNDILKAVSRALRNITTGIPIAKALPTNCLGISDSKFDTKSQYGCTIEIGSHTDKDCFVASRRVSSLCVDDIQTDKGSRGGIRQGSTRVI